MSETCYHCGRVDQLVPVINYAGETRMVCQDGIRCARRQMAAEGVKLLPHPKNPEPLRLVQPEEDA